MRYMTAGESHGPQLTAIIDGVPAGLRISEESINADLGRRQAGYGRGGRMAIEQDRVTITSGVRFGRTLGTPIALTIQNRDWEHWTDRMAAFGDAPADLQREVTPRPGHADLVGVLKIDSDDCRDVLERASARETAARVPGSEVHDPIQLVPGSGFTRASNNAGGLEGGMTTGMPLIATCAMKPIPTLMTPLETVNLDTLEPAEASKERSDVCAVPACAVVAESEMAFALAQAYLEKFGHDNMADIKANLAAYRQRLKTAAK